MPRRPPPVKDCPVLLEILKRYDSGLRSIHIQLWRADERARHERLIERGLVRWDGEQWVLTEEGRRCIEAN